MRSRWLCSTHVFSLSQLECRVSDGKNAVEYDLQALMMEQSNWEVVGIDQGESEGHSLEINVCRPLVAEAKLDCGPFSGACKVVS